MANGIPYVSEPVPLDGKQFDPAAVYGGGVLVATSGGTATVDVYDGHDTSGDLIDSFEATTSKRDRSHLETGILLKRGLYVDVGSNVSAFTVYYLPTPRELG